MCLPDDDDDDVDDVVDDDENVCSQFNFKGIYLDLRIMMMMM